MSEQYLINGLIKKRDELMGEIQELRIQLSQAEEGVIALEKTILIFNPNFEFLEAKTIQKKKVKYFECGELKILIFEILKKHNTPLDLGIITQAIINEKQLNIKDQTEMKKLKNNIHKSLDYYFRHNLLDKEYNGSLYQWSIKIPNQ